MESAIIAVNIITVILVGVAAYSMWKAHTINRQIALDIAQYIARLESKGSK